MHLLVGEIGAPSRPDDAPPGLSALSISAFAFQAFYGSDSWGTVNNASLYSSGGSGAFAAPVLLPSGAAVYAIHLLGCDFSTDSQAIAMFFSSSLDAGGEHLTAHLGVSTVQDTAVGCADFAAEAKTPIVIDNQSQTYWIQVLFDRPGASVRFQGIRLLYKLQMSPAPSVATFADVPKNHPYFRAVEALAASGITGGCGNGKFCPDLPVTRGALAKFLANALGLYWGSP